MNAATCVGARIGLYAVATVDPDISPAMAPGIHAVEA